MRKSKTHEQFVEEVYGLVENEYEVLGKYINAKTKIKMKHNKCQNFIEILPDDFLQGKRCKFCSHRSFKKTTEEFKQEVYNLVKDEYIVLDEYKNNKTKIKFKHIICGTEFLITPSNFISGKRCKKCSIEHVASLKRKTHENFCKEIYNIHNNEYTILGKYINNNTKILVQHNCDKCKNYVFETYPYTLLSGCGCPKCANNLCLTQTDFENRVYDLTNGEYKVIGKYINAQIKIEILHTKCNQVWSYSPNKFINFYSRCVFCSPNYSKGEEKIKLFLSKNNFKYIPQYKFDDCISNQKRPLSFDFAVFDNYNNLKLLIEFQGEQHYKSVEYWGGNDNYLKQKMRDNIKRNYCKNNNINLIEIPYWEFDNIEFILNKELRR